MIGKTLLHYEILSILGKGGMGEVFKARDTKLGREVALKVLPKELSGDPERENRFVREARALAALQHHNVASVYGFEEAEGLRFLVMELISGAELTVRMDKGAVPVEETLTIARQIAAGLEAAHESGIVHRDLKPANIMETDEGEIKILDFGLAQAWFGDEGTQQESGTAPTMTAAMTQMGAILGTAAYMSPEQARGVNVDRRTDIWAFGVIMYEMLTGEKLFQGDTISDTLAAVLRKEPDWDALPVEEAPELCRLIERCLERNPKQRLRDIGEARIFLQDGGSSGTNLSFSAVGMSAPTTEIVKSGPPVWLTAALIVVGLVAGSFLGMNFLGSTPEIPLIHAMFPPPPNTQYQLTGTGPGPAVLSPDGTMLAFTVLDDNAETTLYLRHLDKGESTPISGTRGAVYPFWSPDSKFIAFFVNGDGKLKKVAVAGGPPVSLCNAENGKGGAWNEAGDILFAARAGSGISRVPAVGGEPVPVTRMDGIYNSHRHPRFLPGGREFIFVARPASSSQSNDIILASLDTNVTPRVIAQSQTHAEYVDGHLMAVREDVLMAIPFTPDMDRVLEGGTPLVENVLSIMGAAIGVFSASDDGMLIFQTGASNNEGRQVYWTNRAGGGTEVLGDRGEIFHPAVSPDGTRAVIEVHGESTEGVDLWILDLTTGLRTRFTFAPGDETRPVWTPDGQKVIYRTARDSVFTIMEQPVEGRGGAAILLESKYDLAPFDVSPDGSTLLLDFQREDTQSDIRTLDLQGGDGIPVVLADHPENSMGGGVYSPDGRWIAYHTETAAAWDVFVMPATGGTRKWQVTSSGTAYPEWNEDGTELWASSFNGTLLAYEVDGTGETFRVGGFTEMAVVTSPDGTGNHYDLHPDGERLVQAGPDPDFQRLVSHLHLVTDWKRGLMR